MQAGQTTAGPGGLAVSAPLRRRLGQDCSLRVPELPLLQVQYGDLVLGKVPERGFHHLQKRAATPALRNGQTYKQLEIVIKQISKLTSYLTTK